MIPIIGSIAAIILGYSARKEIARTPGLEGDGLAAAGIILGWIGLAFVVVGFFLLLAIVAGARTGG